jgi:hypothetical protein
MQRTRLWTLAMSALFAGAALASTIREADVDNYRTLLRELNPGDVLRLPPGMLRQGLRVHGLNGAPGKPIVIEGAPGPRRTVLVARAGANTISIADSSFVTIRNLDLDGRGLPVAGVRCEGDAQFAHDITLENLTIRNHGAGQGTVGIAVFCPAWNWTIRGNRIFGAGTGMYLGQSDGSAPFVNGLIEGNIIVDPLGYGVQIKHQVARPELPGMPTRPAMTVLRRNVLVKRLPASSPENARPNLLMGHFPRSGAGSEDWYVIYGNLFYQNPSEALLQAEGSVAAYANLFVNEHGDAIHVQPHNDVPRRVYLARNTVIARGRGVLVRGVPPEGSYRTDANVIFDGATANVAGEGTDLVRPLDAAPDLLTQPWGPLHELDLSPQDKQLIGNRRPIDFLFAFPAGARDFEGREYDDRYRGAYAGPRVRSLPVLPVVPP